MGKQTDYEDSSLEEALIPDNVIEVEKKKIYDCKKKKCKCRRRVKKVCKFFIKLIALGLAVAVVLATVASIFGYKAVRRQVIRFTTTNPKHFPKVEPIPFRDCNLILDDAKTFFDMILAGRIPENDFSVSVDQINGCFIAPYEDLNGNAWLAVEQDKMTLDMSLPMDGMPGGKGRYFVATETAKISDNNKLSFVLDTPQSIDGVKGPIVSAGFEGHRDASKWIVHILHGKFMNYEIPQEYIIRQDNILDVIYEDDDAHDAVTILEGLDGFSFDDGSITIHARRDGKAPTLPTATTMKKNLRSSSSSRSEKHHGKHHYGFHRHLGHHKHHRFHRKLRHLYRELRRKIWSQL